MYFLHTLATFSNRGSRTENVSLPDMDDDIEVDKELFGDDEVGNRLKASCHPKTKVKKLTKTSKAITCILNQKKYFTKEVLS